MPDNIVEYKRHSEIGADLDEVYANSRKRILVVDDEPDMVFLLKHTLRSAGYDVLGATSGQEALRKFSEVRPDLVLLDLMMPGMSGWETYHYLHQISDTPVVIVSAVVSKDEIVRALHMGVDDYITKPFINAEVVARVEAVLRRSRSTEQESDRLLFPEVNLIIDPRTQEVMRGEKHIHLTGREFDLLTLLARNAPTIVPHQEIATQIWGEDDTTETRNRSKCVVHLLRRKFQSLPGQPQFIESVGRLGYRLCTTLDN